jgi:2'-5' RNA ligase
MLPTQSKYFLAIVPPEPVLSEVCKIKMHFRDKYGCKAPLRSPAHITLHMPFLWKKKKEEKMIEILVRASKNYKSFEIQLKNFGAYPPRVIYLKVNPNDNLMEMQKDLEGVAKRELNLFNANRLDYPYNPHMTVAFRDLKKDMFPLAWSEFDKKEYSPAFEVNSFHLLKHNGKEWNSLYEIQFTNEK